MGQPTNLVNRTIKKKKETTKNPTRSNNIQYPKLAALQTLFYPVSWFTGLLPPRASIDLRFTSMNLDFWMKTAVNNIYFLLTSSSTAQGEDWTIHDPPVSVLITVVRSKAPSLQVRERSNTQQWPRREVTDNSHIQWVYLCREAMDFLKSHDHFCVTRTSVWKKNRSCSWLVTSVKSIIRQQQL